MRYIIKESQLDSAITEYLYEIFPVDEITREHPEEYNSTTKEGYEDENRIKFLFEENVLFRWYKCEYFVPESPAQEVCPTVSIEHPYDSNLNGLFGNTWIRPFKNWFEENFDLPLKTVEWF